MAVRPTIRKISLRALTGSLIVMKNSEPVSINFRITQWHKQSGKGEILLDTGEIMNIAKISKGRTSPKNLRVTQDLGWTRMINKLSRNAKIEARRIAGDGSSGD